MRRVSSAAMSDTSRRIRRARSVTSSRLPIGVATTIEGAWHGAPGRLYQMYSAEPLPHFVDEYLAYLYEAHPTHATFDGVHLHDDLLEDLSRHGDRRARSARLAASPGGWRPSTPPA